MRTASFFFLILLSVLSAYCQPKPTSANKVPTQKEMQEMLKQAQQMMEKEMKALGPEEKRMMDSLGIVLPNMTTAANNVSGLTDKALKGSYNNETSQVPKKDAARIAAIPAAISTARLPAYISNIQKKSTGMLSAPVKEIGDKLSAYLEAGHLNPAQIGTIAASFWAIGKIETAFYLMGKACTKDLGNADNLCNYAAMLSMMGAQDIAIPILDNLNNQYRQNTTILNNLGQAWFGLGDLAKSEKYLDSAIRIYAYHPQANMTKAAIEESRGNIAKAVEAVKKSMKHSYTREKESKLDELGVKIIPSDYRIPGRKKNDPMNLGAFMPPAYPMTVDQCITQLPIWQEYRQEINQQMGALMQQKQAAAESTVKTLPELLANNRTSPGKKISSSHMYGDRATKILAEVTERYSKKQQELMEKVAAFLSGEGKKLKDEYERQIDELHREDEEQTGEGQANRDFCPKYKEASDKFLGEVNARLEDFYKQYLQLNKTYLNEAAHWSLYIYTPEEYEDFQLGLRLLWLNILKADAPLDFISITKYNCKKANAGKNGAALQKFDNVACQYKDTLNMYVFSIANNCSSVVSKLDLKFFEYSRVDDFSRAEDDTYVRSTVKVSVEGGKDISAGPLKVEAKVGVAVEVEIGKEGIEDVTVVVEGKVGAGIGAYDEGLEKEGNIGGKDIVDTTVEAGLEGRISIVSGKGSVTGTGVLKGLSVGKW